MAVTSEMVVQVEQLYVALFNRAPDAEGLGYWTQRMSAGEDATSIANAMYATEPARATYPLYLTNAEIVAAFYENVLGRPGDAEGLGYWEAMMNAPGATPGSVIATMIDVVANYDGEDADGLASSALFANKVAVADYFVRNVGTIEGSQAALQGVTADPDSIDDAIAAIGGTPESTVDTHLTVRWDNLAGTAGNDVFTARIVQDDLGSGQMANQLGSGDTIDGKGGTDILDAKVTTGVYAGAWDTPIHPETTSVEIIRLGAMEATVGGYYYYDSPFGGEDLNTDVYINAQNMYGVNEISSYYSDADLNVLNMTTLANDGQTMRSISDMTVSMVHTGNSDSRWGASDMAVLFDQDYLVPVQSSKSTAWYWLLDQDADMDGNPNKLDHINVDGIRFTIDGGPIISLADPAAQTAGTWEGFVAALQGRLAELIADGTVPADTTLTVDAGNTRTTYLDNGAQSSPVPAIMLHTNESVTFDPVGYSQVPDALGQYNVWGRFDNQVETEQHMSINVVLEKAGRAGEGGELQIGSMSKYTSNDWNGATQYPDTFHSAFAKAGIPEFDVTVKGDASKPSSLSGLHSTNNVLEKIVVTTDAAVTGDKGYASLKIGNGNSYHQWDGGSGTRGTGIWDVATVDASAFLGDFDLTAAFGGWNMKAKYGPAVDLNYAFGSGNDTLYLNLRETGSDVAKYAISMGAGDDTVHINLDADAVDAMTESFLLDLGAGNDRAIIHVDNSYDTRYDAGSDSYVRDTSDSADDGFTKLTTDTLKNLTVLGGGGDDYIEIRGSESHYEDATLYPLSGTVANFNIKAGDGSDFVFINSGGRQGFENLWDSDVHAIPEITVAPTVMYKGQVQLRYAGFESTQAIDVGPDFILTTAELNAAILKALQANPELSRMLNITLDAGNQSIDVRSLIDGNNLLEVSIFQPELVAASPTNGQVTVGTGDVTALKAALIKAGAVADSDGFGAGVEAVFNNWADGTGNGLGTSTSALYDGAADTSGSTFDGVAPDTDGGVSGQTAHFATTLGGTEGLVANSSVINMGPGANDLVVLSSYDTPVDQGGDAPYWGGGSSNTLVFDAAWGKVSIVNFFVNENVLVNGVTGEHGTHKLDFTAFLNNQWTTSGSDLSAKPIAIEVVDGTSGSAVFSANNIVIADVDALELAANPTGEGIYTFANLSAANVQAALNANTTGYDYVHTNQGVKGSSTAGLMNATQTSLLFVENIDHDGSNGSQDSFAGITGTLPYDNHGEYKVFQVQYQSTATNTADSTDGFTVTLLGTLDFGHSLDVAVLEAVPGVNLVGGLNVT